MAYRSVLDFNGDGKSDIAGADDNPTPQFNNVSVLQNDGQSGFTQITLSVSNFMGGVFFGGFWSDFNADGRPDYLANFSTEPKMVIFYNNGNGGLEYGAPLAFEAGSGYPSVWDDMNHDGRVDFITTGPPSAGSDEPNYYLHLSTGNGTYGPRILVVTLHGNLYLGDFDGNGVKDIAIVKAISNSNQYTLKFWLQNGGGSFAPTREVSIGTFQIDGVNEFNTDGRADFYGSTSFTSMSFLLNNPAKSPTLVNYPAIYKDGSYRMYFGDFNGDGRGDALDSGRAGDASYGYSLYLGNGKGSFRSFSKPFSLDDQDYNKVAQALDLNNDGMTDLVRFSTDILNHRVKIDLLKAVCDTKDQTTTAD
jgi:hypothetical protein